MESESNTTIEPSAPVRKSRSLGVEIFALVLISAILGFVYNAFSPKSLALIRVEVQKNTTSDESLFTPISPATTTQQAAPTDTVVDSASHKKIPVYAPLHDRARTNPDSTKKAALQGAAEKKTGYSIISLEQLQKLMNEHRGVIVDARGADEFTSGHIPGAKNIPYQEFQDHLDAMMQIPQDTLVVVYCTGPDCHLGRGLYDVMTQMEFKRVYLYDAGWEGWKKANLPFEGTDAKK